MFPNYSGCSVCGEDWDDCRCTPAMVAMYKRDQETARLVREAVKPFGNIPKAKIDAIISNENYEDLATRIPTEKKFDAAIEEQSLADKFLIALNEHGPRDPDRCLKIEPALKKDLDEGFIKNEDLTPQNKQWILQALGFKAAGKYTWQHDALGAASLGSIVLDVNLGSLNHLVRIIYEAGRAAGRHELKQQIKNLLS